MTVPPKPIPPELLAEARRLYEETRVPVDDISAMLGIGSRTFYTRLRTWRWRKRILRGPLPAPEPEAEQPARADPPAGEGGARFTADAEPAPVRIENVPVAVRVQRAVERELAAIEHIIANLRPGSTNTGEAERAARTLASLARTLREVMRLEAPPEVADTPYDDDQRDLDELRDALSRKLDQLVAQAKAGVPGQPEQT